MPPENQGAGREIDLKHEAPAKRFRPAERDDRKTDVMARILIVEDSESTAMAQAYHLWNAGHTVAFARTGVEAMSKRTSADAEVVLLDYDLPDMSGLEVFRRIRAEDPEALVVMITGKGNEMVAAQVLKEGAKDYLVKSEAMLESLAHVVEQVLREEQIRRRLKENEEALRRSEKELRRAYETLEKRVQERTAELAAINDQLKSEIIRRRQVETELREQFNFLRVLMDTIPSPIFYKDAEGRYLGCNKAFEEFLGRTREEIIGRTVHEVALENLAAKYHLMDQKVFTQPGVQIYEEVVRHSNGTDRHAIFHKAVIRDRQGEITGLVGVMTDITYRKQTEEALRREKDKARSYLDLAGVIFVALDPDGRVTMINQKGCQILEAREEEVLNQDWFNNFIPEREREKAGEVFKQLLSGRIEISGCYENSVLSRSGKEKLIAWHNAVLKDDEGRIIEVLSSGEDVTLQRKLEAQLIQTQKMEAIGTLAGGIAHDFNNVLSAINGYTELALLELSAGHPARTRLELVLKATKRAADLVNQILTFSRQTELKPRSMITTPILKETLKLLRASLPATIEIRTEIKSENGSILADPTQIHQVIMNLCANAGYAMRETGGVLTVVLDEVTSGDRERSDLPVLPPGDYQMLIVRDTGPGIPTEIIERIFEPFFTTKKSGEGTGMGLAVVHGIVSGCRGEIKVNSQAGRGAEFRVFLPLIQSRISQAEPLKIADLPQGRENILVIDDENAITEVCRDVLARFGYKVTTLTSSLEALKEFRGDPNRFDLVITDHTMPKMTGLELARQLLRLRPDLPIVLCTGFSHQVSEETARRAGVRRVLMKPFETRQMLETIRTILDEASVKSTAPV
ncbi:MAG: response regulator [Thermodesulfobacteriota bacterium]